MERLESALDRLASLPKRNRWAWPVLMVVLGAGAMTASLVIQPGSDQLTYLFGQRFGGECGFLEATGLPCPSCGMTRSWLWLARGDLVRAFQYNAAGAIVLLGLLYMSLVGAVRLITRDPTKWQMPFRFLSTGVIVWMLGPYLTLWFLRMAGFNPLP